MNIEFKNFGALKEAKMQLAPLTLLCGTNNTSKTYALYAIYGLLRPANGRAVSPEWLPETLVNEVSEIDLEKFFQQNKTRLQNSVSRYFSASLSHFFSTEETAFADSQISLHVDLEPVIAAAREIEVSETYKVSSRSSVSVSKPANSLLMTITQPPVQDESAAQRMYVRSFRSILSQIIADLFLQPWSGAQQILLPAERGGLNLFYPELNSRRTALFHHASRTKIDVNELLRDITIARYPRPIADYIDLLNDMGTLRRKQSEFQDLALRLQNDVLGGEYKLDRDGAILFKPQKVRKSLGLHLSSSTAKSYFGLWFYLQHMAQPGDVLMIDEPELNLHPDNQRLIARLFAMMVKRGIRIVLSTHSDYIVREFNNLLILDHEFPERTQLRGEFKYREDESLSESSVLAYCFGSNTITPMEISPEEGIIAETFDKVINELNDSSYKLASSWAEFRAEQIEAKRVADSKG